MASERNPKDTDDSATRTIVGVRPYQDDAAPFAVPASEPGATIVGFSPVQAASAPPPDATAEETVIGMRRLPVPPLGPRPTAPAAFHPGRAPEPVSGQPNFGGLAMPLAGAGPEAGSTLLTAPVSFPTGYVAPEAGGTMIGMGRVTPPPRGFAPPAPDAGGTMIGVGRVPVPAPFATGAAEAGATIVGVGRVSAPGWLPAGPPEAGGTMVGVGRVPYPPSSFAVHQPEAGATMIGVGRVPTAVPGPSAQVASGPAETMIGGRIRMAPLGMPYPSRLPEPERVSGQVPALQPPATDPVSEERAVTEGGLARFAAPAPAEEIAEEPAPAPLSYGDSGETDPDAPEEATSPHSSMSADDAAEAPTPTASAPAQVPAGRPSGPPPAYEIIKHLGGGDLGQVFHARHRETGAEVALRIIRPDIAGVPGALDALRDVVSLAQSAVHTHLGRQLELDESATPTMVLEYVPGRTLASLMQERGLAPPPAVVDLGVRICSALAAAHGAGLAHGRVHAGNVVLEANTGRWVLLDVGHGYAVQGLEPSHDLYALGAMLYEMATGHSPFEESETPKDPRLYVSALPGMLSALLLRSLAADPGLWFPSAVEFAQALGRARGRA